MLASSHYRNVSKQTTRISIYTVNNKYHSDVLAEISRIMHRTPLLQLVNIYGVQQDYFDIEAINLELSSKPLELGGATLKMKILILAASTKDIEEQSCFLDDQLD
ncbi:hypothetical protein Tco_1018589 [Tanacetum coccineum]|uniref:Uncharacterized protein n=1 Tax=Tanacetum coccineum TaxID=301880 RepID=A0ABQ5FV88_9ASTR